MKKVMVLVFLLIGSFVYAQESENRNVGSFRGIKSSTGIDVYLKKGNKESVRVEVSGTDIKNVLTEVSGDYLKIHMAEGRYNRTRTVKVYVTYVELTKLSCSSASSIYADEIIKTRSLSLSASSAGSIDVGIDVESLTVSVSSAAEIELRGKAKRIEMEASSAAKVDGYDLEAEEADLSASSAGSIRVSVSQKIDARASSGADIRYRGSPMKTNTNSSSGGSVRKSS
ncbi:MAG TPA: head GIN domain-containing protein [Cyclobacteriaceae bacterium]|nr:head GIN domain-containing protein [Cyclobacteriaceae bacterium]HRJ82358.1 head GIN domain-containing protein [Cyclobacteriaceae bacterium]